MMKKWSTRLLSALCVAALMLGLLPLGALAATPEHTLWLVGDSTVCSFNDKYFYPRYGYGTQIGNYLDGTYEVKNLAVSGTSSKSFTSHANYATLTAGMKAGDALIIGFGHNDEKVGEEARYTDPKGNWQTEGSFAKSLWDNYVSKAQAKNVEVVLCTPIVRWSSNATISGNNAHDTAQGNYATAIQTLGTDKSIPVVDLTAKTKALYEQLGPDQSANLHAWLYGDVKYMDGTHLNLYGAQQVAWMLAQELKAGGTTLGTHVKSDVASLAPTKDVLVGDEAYRDPPAYTPPTEDSKIFSAWTGTNKADNQEITFKGTAFGSLGGNPNTTNFKLEKTASGDMRVAVVNVKGKVASSEEGFVMYYYPVPVGKKFTFSATATLEMVGDNNPNQAAFGLMARDDMYIDTNDKAILGDYVAAGTFGDGSANCFKRQDKVLSKSAPTGTISLAAGQSYDLKIAYNGDGYACTFGDQPTQSAGYDFQLIGVDNQYVYVCLFASRLMDVTYSNISLTITDGDDPVTPPVDPDDPKPEEPSVTGAVAGGGLEALFAELPGVADADVTAVKYTGAMAGELAGDDLTYLVRDVKGGVRVDIPGLKAGKYDLTVTAKGKDYVAKDIEVQAHDRSGFAHYNYTEGVGAYNDDGTIKDNALILYVTDENKDTVTASFTRNGDPKTITGIGNILHSNNSKVNQGLLEFLSKENKRPLVVRFIGTVNQPQGVTAFQAGKTNGGMVQMLSGANITLEGIGPDATIQGWGFSFGADKDDTQYNKKAKNFEVRNLTFKEVPEDCVEITGFANADGSIKESVEHTWVHNCAFYRPSDIQNPAESDKAQGDGSVDFKSGQYMTMSYNYFERNHKTSLVGSADKIQQYHVTWHHNWWKNVESRAPLGRQADMHIYNNLYDGQKSYCMSLRGNAYVFSEYNTFLGCKNPVLLEATSGETPALPIGACKSYQDDFSGCTGTNAATIVTDKTQKVDSTNKYPNFDTAPGSYIAKGDYKLDTLADAKKNIEAWGGVLKTADKLTTVELKEATGGETPEEVNKTALNKAIADAEKKVAGIYTVSDDTVAADVNRGKEFVTESGKTALQAAIAAAKAVAENGEATQDQVDKAVADLAAAIKANVKKGTKGGSSSGATSGRPSGDRGDKPNTDQGAIDVNKPASENFSDVAKDSWYEPGVTYVVKKNLFKGVADKTFAPEQNMTRAMLMTVLARLDGKDTEGGDTWYAKGMAWAVETGISDGTMAESNVTREQMVTMLYRYAKPTGAEGELSAFVDSQSVSDWARDAMTWAVELGIINGKDGQRLDPQGTATRAEVATILQRFVEKTGK